VARADFKCSKCETIIELDLKDKRLCEKCGKEMQRVWTVTAVHYKGSGFYTTDYARDYTKEYDE